MLAPWGCALGSGEGRQAGVCFSAANRCLERGGSQMLSGVSWSLLCSRTEASYPKHVKGSLGLPLPMLNTWGCCCGDTRKQVSTDSNLSSVCTSARAWGHRGIRKTVPGLP